jgi:23S rRNA (cytosine1962-C5)-methyltransferase
VVVSRRGRDRLLGGHRWVFKADVRSVNAASGDVVEVSGPSNEFLGRAFYSEPSQISLRLITSGDEAVDEAFWRRRLLSALHYRRPVAETTNAYRWVHGEADGIPSLVVDRYGDYLSLQTLSPGTERLKPDWVRWLTEIGSPLGILERNDPKVRGLEGLPSVKGALHGSVPGRVTVEEAGIRFEVDLSGGQKTGLFLDQRENHLIAARVGGGRALDVFSYAGGFSLHLARVCETVMAVESSHEAMELLRTNARLNGMNNIDTVEANAFDQLRALAEKGELFDTIILDPPAFAKNRASVPQAWRGYKEINLRAIKLLRPGGYLITSTCSYHVSEGDFVEIVAAAAADARTGLLVVEKRQQAMDHPVLLTMPETHYLKCLVLKKL